MVESPEIRLYCNVTILIQAITFQVCGWLETSYIKGLSKFYKLPEGPTGAKDGRFGTNAAPVCQCSAIESVLH